MDITNKIDLFINDEMAGGMTAGSGATTTANVAKNLAKGHIDIVGGRCPDGQIYDRIKKVCVPKKNESSVVGGSYISGTTVNITGSGQTRTWGVKRGIIQDLARKEPLEKEMDDPTDTNILGRKGLKFNKKTGAYTPSLWGDDE